jgi:hypothetical protein
VSDRATDHEVEASDELPRDHRGIRMPRRCRSYGSGHHAHHIQWKQARRDPATQTPAEILTVGERSFTISLDGEAVELQHHDIERVAELADLHDRQIVAQLRWSVVWIGDYLVSVRPSRNPPTPCTDDETGGAVVEAATRSATADRLARSVGVATKDGA